MDFICKDIFTIVVWAYPPADKYANMKSGQIHWNILNMGMNMQESTIGLNIICSGGVPTSNGELAKSEFSLYFSLWLTGNSQSLFCD
jgi:hypothetical protein